MFRKHRLQNPTRFVSLSTKSKVSPKPDEIMGNSSTATAVPSVTGSAPLYMLYKLVHYIISLKTYQNFKITNLTYIYL